MSQSLPDYLQQNRERQLEGLKDLLRIPSISALPDHKSDVRRAADFLCSELTRIGINNVKTIEGEGHPIVYGEWLDAPDKPTLILYGHYDVQPPDPLDEWESEPFEPTERNDNLYARGAVDDKGHMIHLHLCFLRRMPVNLSHVPNTSSTRFSSVASFGK